MRSSRNRTSGRSRSGWSIGTCGSFSGRGRMGGNGSGGMSRRSGGINCQCSHGFSQC